MKVFYERVNQRYRGPFEQEKLAFLFNQIKKNLTALYNECELQKAQIKTLPRLNETQGFDLLFTAEQGNKEQEFENKFRDTFLVSSKDSLTPKERLRDLLNEIDNYIKNTDETF